MTARKYNIRVKFIFSTVIKKWGYCGYSFIWAGGMFGPRGYSLSAVLVINRVSILAILVRNTAWFLPSGLVELRILLRRIYFFILTDKTISKKPYVNSGKTVSAATVMSRVSNLWSDHK